MRDVEQVAFFRENGYLVVPGVLTPAQLEAVDARIALLERGAVGLTATNAVYDLEPFSTPDHPVLRRIFQPVDEDEVFYGICRSEAVLDCLEPLLGPDIQFHHSKINMKPGRGGSPVRWHQDYPFFPHTNTDLVACLIALDEATCGNGCLQVIAGSHALGPLDHTRDGEFCGMLTADMARTDRTRTVDVELHAGDMAVMHALAVHGSAPNTSDQRRRLLILEYRAADAVEMFPGPGPATKRLSRYYGMQVRGRRPSHARLTAGTVPLPVTSGKFRSLYDLQVQAAERAP